MKSRSALGVAATLLAALAVAPAVAACQPATVTPPSASPCPHGQDRVPDGSCLPAIFLPPGYTPGARPQ